MISFILEAFLANNCLIFFSGFPGDTSGPLLLQRELLVYYPFSYTTTFIALEPLVTGDLFITPICLQPLDSGVYSQFFLLTDLVSLNAVKLHLFSYGGLVPFECSPSQDFIDQEFLAQMCAQGQ